MEISEEVEADDALAAGRAFLDGEARLVERRLAEVLFDAADASGLGRL